MLNKAKHKTRLTQNKSKTYKICKQKEEGRKRNSDRITLSPFPSKPWKNIFFD